VSATGPGLLDAFRLPGRVAVVTGSGQGIGRAIAVGLAEAGCDVVVNARRRSDLAETAAAVEALGRRALIVDGDIRDFSEELADRTMDRFGRIDVWVNNVGGSDEQAVLPLVDTPDGVFRSQLELNLTTAFQGCKAAAARMGPGSAIVNVSSGAGTRGSPLTGPYAAAKSGLNNLTQTLALELAPDVRVNAVAPGPVATESFRPLLGVADRLDEIAATIPMGRRPAAAERDAAGG
jgi:7-alpha-hydroxysteroid dehydrogenase